MSLSGMNRRTILKTVGGIAGAGTFGPSIVSAAEPWPREETQLWYTHTELLTELDHLNRHATVDLEPIGESIEGRELVVATVGNGDTDVFIVTEQHGSEPHPTNAMLEELRHLSTAGGYASKVREELTVHLLPMLNPDGAMRNQRENVDGYDPNRHHDYEPGSDDNPSPEAQAMIDYVTDIEPLWVADLHIQGGPWPNEKDNPGDYITSSNFWSSNPNVEPAVVDRAKRLNVAMWDRVEEFANAKLSVFPGGTGANIARNAYGLRGYSTVLNELGASHAYEGLNGQFIRQCRKENQVLLEETADGTAFDRDPDRVEEIPVRPDWDEMGDWPWEQRTA